MPLLGCAGGPPAEQAVDPRLVAAEDYDAALAATVAVLRDRGFVIDRQDRRFGVVTTEALGAATVFEPWKPNHVTAAAAVRSTLNDQRRTVTVTFTPAWDPPREEAERDAADPAAEGEALASAPPPYLLSVEVQVERRQVVTRRVGGAPANRVFSYYDAPPAELRRRGLESDFWRPLGREPDLEAQIARQITQRLAS